MSVNVVIVGAGQAGAWVARTLRKRGFAGTVTLLGREQHAPYERPPLSKEVLLGDRPAPPFLLDDAQCASLGIDFHANVEVASVDRLTKQVSCADGRRFAYDRLVLATGGTPRRIASIPPGTPGVLELRTIDDAQALKARLRPGARMLVIGGGWIGLEVAATARKREVDVTLVEAGERLCARTVPPILSDYLLRLHLEQGVDIRLREAVGGIAAAPSGRFAAALRETTEVFDVIVVGIGIAPNDELAAASGLEVRDGIVVDACGRTSDADVFAVGDVARHPCRWSAGSVRLETWANAQNQAIAVGRNLAGEPCEYDEVPWFWSDQYGRNLQVLGIPATDATFVVRGAMDGASFSLFDVTDGRIRAAIGVNAPRDVRMAKKWMVEGTCPDLARLADPQERIDRL